CIFTHVQQTIDSPAIQLKSGSQRGNRKPPAESQEYARCCGECPNSLRLPDLSDMESAEYDGVGAKYVQSAARGGEEEPYQASDRRLLMDSVNAPRMSRV